MKFEEEIIGLGCKIRDCIKENGECCFDAELV